LATTKSLNHLARHTRQISDTTVIPVLRGVCHFIRKACTRNSEDGRFKLLHDVYQSKTSSTSSTSLPARELVPTLLESEHTAARKLCVLWKRIRESLASESIYGRPPPLRAWLVSSLSVHLVWFTLPRIVCSIENCKRATTECDLGKRLKPRSQTLPTRAQRHFYFTIQTVALVFDSLELNTREGVKGISTWATTRACGLEGLPLFLSTTLLRKHW